jgi:serine protease
MRRSAALAAALLTVLALGGHAAGAGRSTAEWNLAGPYGVDAPNAWANVDAAGAPGGRGVRVAVLDTGVTASGLLPPARLVGGWDFVDDDPEPQDEHGHGSAVAATIAAEAYGAGIMPIRVMDARGQGDAERIARGVRYAADHGAKVINLSFTFGRLAVEGEVTPLLEAIAYATARNALVVGASGNAGAPSVDYPARSRRVLAVGATTEFGCAAAYSNFGPELDLVAPGGGPDADLHDPHCKSGRNGRGTGVFGGVGTSLAVAHVSAAAALVVASRIVGPDPSPARIARRLERTARDLGPRGRDERYGWGLVSAGAATARSPREVLRPARYPRGSRAQ